MRVKDYHCYNCGMNDKSRTIRNLNETKKDTNDCLIKHDENPETK